MTVRLEVRVPVVPRDPIPQTREAINRLIADVGAPGLDALYEYVDTDEHGKKVVGRSTVHDLLTGPENQPRAPRWLTITAVIEASRRYHRAHASSGVHRDMAAAGKFDAQALRPLFETETGTAPEQGSGFESARRRYLERVRQRYQRVDLEILTPMTDQGEHPPMLLDEVFAPQHVRADPPPVEVPREVWRRLAEAGQDGDCDLPEQVDRERLEAARRAYLDRPALPVLRVLAESTNRKAVVLGDPGAGKSTLARYLMLAHAAAGLGLAHPEAGHLHRSQAHSAGWLPFLVELRSYADLRWQDRTFLDLIDSLHAAEGLGLPKAILEDFLDRDGRALVVFDGLDEVFDPRRREEITRQIEGFAAAYPRTRVIVTSRVVGYRRAMLDSAGFSHWMLQDLDPDQIREFVGTWYARSCPTDPCNGVRLRDRLLVAVDDSNAVAELAGNPMLLTILTIIGRRRELPRDRRSVYEHAVTVLVEHWDVNKHLRDERVDIDYLDARDKLELLHLIARHMQDAPAGLAGNHIPGPDLTDRFRGYLEERFALPPDRSIPAARAMLTQFRERNFILARFGAEVYEFVHRAFLEYLAADDLTQRLTDLDLTPDELLAVYDDHWHDPAWTEVLLLLTGMIPDRIAAQAIARLLDADPRWRLRPHLPRHLLLALEAAAEIRKIAALTSCAPALTRSLAQLLSLDPWAWAGRDRRRCHESAL